MSLKGEGLALATLAWLRYGCQARLGNPQAQLHALQLIPLDGAFSFTRSLPLLSSPHFTSDTLTTRPSGSRPEAMEHIGATHEMSATPGSPPRSPSMLRTGSRTSSIRRKPVPVDELEMNEADSARTRSLYGGGVLLDDAEEGLHSREGSASTSGMTRPYEGTPNPLRRTPSTSSRDPYSPASPSTMTPTAVHPNLFRTPSTSSHRPGESHYPPAASALSTEEVLPLSSSLPSTSTSASAAPIGNGLVYPTTAGRSSLHSHRSSIAPESVFGTAPVGVIGKTKPREVIRIERDYSAGETCQFWSGWIWELEGRISPTDYQNTLNELNTVLASAHDPYKSCLDNCLSVLTLYLSPLVLTSHFEREIRHFHRILERANRELFNPVGLNLLSPKRNAYLFLEIEYY